MRRCLSALVFASAALAGDAWGQQLSPRDIWPQATAAARDGDFELAEKHATELLGTGRTYGIRTFPLYATAAAGLASESGGATPELTRWALATATALDPKSPAVAFSEADRAMRANDWPAVFRQAATGLVRSAGNYRSSLLARADLIFVGSIAVAVTAIVLALSMFIRYGRSMAHDFRELLSLKVRGGAVSVLAFALLFLPVFLWLGPMWLAFYWFAIFFAYAGIAERIAIVVVLAVLAATPLAVSSAANQVSGVDSPIVAAALSGATQSYRPDAVRRLQELIGLVPDDATLHVLAGNLQSFEGLDDQAGIHYRRAIELRPRYAGAHVNLGNLLFLNNEFQAAITEYEKAQQADGDLAIAFYNHSVAAGETYKFDQQAQMLERARAIDRSLIERLRRTPPAQKIVMYHPPIPQAWDAWRDLANEPAARALFGNYSSFDASKTALNSVTIGSVLALLLGPGLWALRRKGGLANACIKCGRTFCGRCKSARESATYCTQCIHIYLKRDGVSLDTKRKKLEEVSNHLTGIVRRNRIFATFLPGSAQMMEGAPSRGIAGIFLFSLFVAIAVFVGRLAPAIGPTADATQLLLRAGAVFCAVVAWALTAVPAYRRKVAG